MNSRRHILLRYLVVILLMLVLAGAIVWHLVDNTYLSADKWNKRATEELVKVDTIRADRGDILACDGSVLATTTTYYTLRIDYTVRNFNKHRYAIAIDSLADSLARYFPNRTRDQWAKRLREGPKSPYAKCYPLIARLSYGQYLRVMSWPFFNIGKASQTGRRREPLEIRLKPYGDMARRSIGTVGMDSTSTKRRGRSGLEMALDSLLAGRDGLSKRIFLTRRMVDWEDVPPLRGYDVTTTIDVKMQDIVEHHLNNMLEHTQARWGLCVLMEVNTGEIKAISNLERNDATGLYTEGLNRAVLPFEPGSVVKVLSMLIALEKGVVSDTAEIVATDPAWHYAGVTYRDHTSVPRTVSHVLPVSSNIGIVKIISRGFDKRPGDYYSAVKEIGFLDPLNTGIAGEQVPIFDSINNTRGEGLSKLASQAFGYACAIPPMHTLALYNAIANDGKFVRPHLVRSVRRNGRDSVFAIDYIRDSICSRRNAAILRDMLHNVVKTERGTAYRALHKSTVDIAGKTGTAQMIIDGHYDPAHKRLAFCGFFPYDKPKYSCMVLICEPTQNAFGAPSTSATVMRNIAESFYARGMFDNASDYREHDEHALALDPSPVFYASTSPDHAAGLQSSLGIQTRLHHVRNPKPPTGKGVPDVRGLNIREALKLLEGHGYSVSFTGQGCVTSQSPAAGSNVKAGTSVALVLSP